MANGKLIFLFFLLISLTTISNDLYTNALNAYLEGDYRRALRLFEESLQKDPMIEERDPFVKLKMGICAYAIGDYNKARAYLSNFPDNVIAKEILSKLSVPEKEWEKYVRSRAPSEKAKTTETPKGFPTWLSITISGGTFLAVFLLQRLL
ncbi:tetratricopeptide repeat protein, partial [Thermotoga sp.]|uniref:tetratricopeptide repeat protein n=1 Tax=Thermotoga sp. TaxID=28240 RepID=UPI0025D5CE48